MNADDVRGGRYRHRHVSRYRRESGKPGGRKLNGLLVVVCLASFLFAGLGFSGASTAHVGPEQHDGDYPDDASSASDGTLEIKSSDEDSASRADSRHDRARMRRALSKFSREGHWHHSKRRGKRSRTGDWTTSHAEKHSTTTSTAQADSEAAGQSPSQEPENDPVTENTPTTAPTTTTSAAGTSPTSPPTTAARSTATTARAQTTAATTPPNPDGELLSIYTPNAGCSEGSTVPRGQGSGAKNFEPLGSIWCFDLAPPPSKTAVEGPNSWVDDFTVNQLMLQFNDGDMGYRIFDSAGGAPGRAQHWINQNHWMVDMRNGFTGGSSMRPDRSFKFENGKIVVEGDFASAIPEYGGETWGEITITSAPAPTGEIADILYAYGQFGGHWTVGCRLQGQYPVCAVEGAESNDAPRTGQCQAIPGGYRVMEISFFLDCGSVHSGGGPFWDEAKRAARQCKRDGPDMACRDRFRLEVTKSSLTLYVNGVKYFEDANWPAAHQLPDSFVNGDVYVYQSNWQHRVGSHAFRYHWDHFAVNPPNGPEPSEWYEFGR